MDKRKEIEVFITDMEKQITKLDIKLLAIFLVTGIGFVLSLTTISIFSDLAISALSNEKTSICFLIISIGGSFYFLAAFINFHFLIAGLMPRKKEENTRVFLGSVMSETVDPSIELLDKELELVKESDLFKQRLCHAVSLQQLCLYKTRCVKSGFISLGVMIILNMIMYATGLVNFV